jgi:hypothetical protein
MKIELGSGFLGLLTIVFITLKLLGKINWSWFWVLSPLIFSLVFGLLIVIIILILVVIYS